MVPSLDALSAEEQNGKFEFKSPLIRASHIPRGIIAGASVGNQPMKDFIDVASMGYAGLFE